ncbi:MAG TPA: YdeI/OmpD-associated family protein [Pyrinomonadaceae bacterium]|mgnify:FL=1|nr:YdeI/OmpD-associated family protein [Acidobacteriota bacterium]HQZ97046.1 YdeI/OmpD-associated family protein [Pyrinomonadaceae bacterium]
MLPKFFPNQNPFREWLEKNHETETELLVRFNKVGSGKPNMTWPESVDQALCFGWIDGVRRRIDDESYSIRFTPRKAGSIWSGVNIRKVEELTNAGVMKPAGIAAFEKRTEKRSAIYSYEKEASELSSEFEKQFRNNKKAWAFFTSQAPSYQKIMIHHIMDAKQEKTRISRLAATISASEDHRRLR